MKTLNYFLAGALMLTACVEKLDTTAPEQNDSEKWEAEFGKVDPAQTWNMATKANLSISAKDAGTIEVFTQNPITKGSMLLMRKQVEAGAHELQFDVPQGSDKVFVQVSNSYGPYVSGYLPLDGTTAVAKAANAPATRADACPVKVTAEKVTINYPGYWDSTVPPYGAMVTPDPDTFMVLEGVESKESPALKMTDFEPICGTDGVYNEGKDNIEKWVKGENAKLQPNVTYTFADDSELELNLVYNGTSYANKFGIAIIDPNAPTRAAARKYIVTTVQKSDIRIKVDAYTIQQDWGVQTIPAREVLDQTCANALNQLKNNPTEAPYMYVYGKTYRIPYVDANGNTSYTFPKGTQIVFFNWAVNNANEVTPRNNGKVNFSMESWNNDISNYYYSRNGQTSSYPSATTFRYGKDTYLGFEDDADYDINDLLFLVNGDFTEKPKQLNPDADEEVEPMTWTLAFEDQISDNKSDFDFNDVVIRVTYAAGEKTAKVTYCAAGGTLQTELFFKEESLGEIHTKLGDPERKSLINTYSKIDTDFVTEDLTVPADFSLSSDAPKFKIKVKYWDGTKESSLPNAVEYGSTPHGFCVPGKWAWPREGLNIKQAYSQFAGWAQNASVNQNWYEQVNASAVISE